MFKLTTTARNWKAVTSSLVTIAEEAILKVSRDGIYCLAFDPSHTEALGFKWDKESFTEFEVEFGGEEFKNMDISVPVLNNAFKRFADDVIITLSDVQGGVLITDGRKKFQCAFFVSLTGESKPPKVPYENHFTVELAKIEEVITDCKVVGSNIVYLNSEDGKLNYSTKEDEGIVSGVIDDCSFAFNRIGFNFTFMEPVLKAVKSYAESKIKVEIVENAPIRVTFTVNEHLVVQYYLAPLVETSR